MGRPSVPTVLGNPYPPVVAQRLAHQGELGLILARRRNTGWVNLGEARIGEPGTATMRAPGRGNVTPFGIGGEKEDVGIAPGRERHRMSRPTLDFPRNQIPGNDPPRHPIHHDHIEHFVTRIHLDLSRGDLALQGLVRPKQQLLPGLSARVECARDLGAPKRPVGKMPAVFAGERHALPRLPGR